jgi:hypothetical protein
VPACTGYGGLNAAFVAGLQSNSPKGVHSYRIPAAHTADTSGEL